MPSKLFQKLHFLKHSQKSSKFDIKLNKTGLQSVSRPVEQILRFYPKGLSAKMCSKMNDLVQNFAKIIKRNGGKGNLGRFHPMLLDLCSTGKNYRSWYLIGYDLEQ